MSNLNKLTIDNTDVFLEDLGENEGKVTVSNTYGYNYSYYWGSMGGNLSKFICSINDDYFASKLMGSKSKYTINIPATFRHLRQFIREELRMPWYREMEFQKDMREKLKNFQNNCESAHYFVDHFYSSFIRDLDFSLIKDKYDANDIKEEFEGISEPWNFIVETENQEYIFLQKLHQKLKKKLSTNDNKRTAESIV